MKSVTSAIVGIAVLATAQATFATDTPKTAAMMPKCAVSDQVVMVNPTTKTYTMYEPSSNAQSRREKANSEPSADVARVGAGLKPMCKSKADAMGAKMAAGATETPMNGASAMPMSGASTMPMPSPT